MLAAVQQPQGQIKVAGRQRARALVHAAVLCQTTLLPPLAASLLPPLVHPKPRPPACHAPFTSRTSRARCEGRWLQCLAFSCSLGVAARSSPAPWQARAAPTSARVTSMCPCECSGRAQWLPVRRERWRWRWRQQLGARVAGLPKPTLALAPLPRLRVFPSPPLHSPHSRAQLPGPPAGRERRGLHV